MNFAHLDDTAGPLWAAWERRGDSRSRAGLVEHYWPLVLYHARKAASRLVKSVEWEELASDGAFGLVDAIHSFEPDRGVAFRTFSGPRICGAMMDAVRDRDHAPRLLRQRVRWIEQATHRLRIQLGRGPTEAEVAGLLKVDPDQVREVAADAAAVDHRSTDRVIADDGGRSVRLQDCLGGGEDRTPETLGRSEARRLLAGLDRTQRAVVWLYVVEQMPLREAGRAIGISESRCSQVLTAALKILRARNTSGGRDESGTDFRAAGGGV